MQKSPNVWKLFFYVLFYGSTYQLISTLSYPDVHTVGHLLHLMFWPYIHICSLFKAQSCRFKCSCLQPCQFCPLVSKALWSLRNEQQVLTWTKRYTSALRGGFDPHQAKPLWQVGHTATHSHVQPPQSVTRASSHSISQPPLSSSPVYELAYSPLLSCQSHSCTSPVQQVSPSPPSHSPGPAFHQHILLSWLSISPLCIYTLS